MAETEFVLKLNRKNFDANAKGASKNFNGAVQEMKREVGGLGAAFEVESGLINVAAEKTSNNLLVLAKRAGIIAIAYKTATTAIDSVKAFADFEKGLIGVGKTANLEGKELAKFGDDIQAMSRDIPVSTAELLELSQAAGQLGVKGSENLLNFSRVMAELASASDVQGEDGAKKIARILGITTEGIQQANQFTNVLVALGNDAEAGEAEILELASRIAQSTAAFDLSSTSILGISAGLKSLDVTAELAGSTILEAFIKGKKAIDDGGAALFTLEQITGKTGEQLKNLFDEDQAGFLQVFIKGLNGVKESGGDVIETLQALDINEKRAVATLATAAKGYSTLSESMDKAEKAAKENNARAVEAKKAFASLDAQIKKAGESVTHAKQELGELFEPFASSTLSLASKMLNGIASNIEKINKELRNETSNTHKAASALKSAARTVTSGTLGFFDDDIIGLAEAMLYPISTYKELTGAAEDAAEKIEQSHKKIGGPKAAEAYGTLIDLNKGLAKQAKLTGQLVKLSAESMATANELSARKSIAAIEKQISKMQEAAAEAQQLKDDIDAALKELNAGPAPDKATDATDAIVKARRSSTGDNPEETIRLGREALEIISKLRNDGVIDDSLAKAQLTELKTITGNAAKEIETKAEENIFQLEKEAKKFEALTFGFDKATVTREADALVAILNGKLQNLVPGINSLAPGGKSLNPANFDTTNNIIQPLTKLNVPAQPAASATKVGVSSIQNLGRLEISPKFSAVTGDAETLKNVKTAVERIFAEAALAN